MASVFNKDDYCSITVVAKMLDVRPATIARWYAWYENDNFEKPSGLTLPSYYFADRRRTKFFKKSDIPKLKDFKHKLATKYFGAMSEYNAVTKWGARGVEALNKKGISYKETSQKLKKRKRSK